MGKIKKVLSLGEGGERLRKGSSRYWDFLRSLGPEPKKSQYQKTSPSQYILIQFFHFLIT